MTMPFRKPIQDCYETLGIDANASTKDINSAYKKLALKYHPDKAGGNDVSSDEFQKIQEAVEILRDPFRRMKHDQELSRIKRVFVEEHFEFDASYTGWRSHSPMWFGPRTANERYMYSYGNSVHMNPNSQEAQEEKERVKNEMKFDAEVRMQEEQELREAKQRAEDEVLKEARRRMAMKARVIRDEELMAEGPDSLGGCDDEEARSADFMYSDDGESGYEDEYSEEGEYYNYSSYSRYYEGPAEDENPEEDLLNFKEGEHDDDDDDDDEAFSDQSTQRTATEYNPVYRSRDNTSPFSENKLSDSHYETGKEDHSEDDSFYYSFSESTRSVKGEATFSSLGQEPTAAEDNYIRVESDLHSHLRPFLPLFESKLNHPSGLYTRADMHSELRGIVMETFCGWLENLRLGFSEAESEGNSRSQPDKSDTCEHLGYWTKEYGRDECEVCHRWKPIYTLTCPGCGLKACVVCKFRC
ncbi:DnaJ-domain-containing protein [Aspergillus steynii IBT 23096]|uniref:DnaJ-domain-containing protein n=1 Tax=Aspergillus steynii IBT 23096 TaxID=1392250 RepID=A0A2I2FWW2_9EURO|nr:DnaJ-domain-containing protein [Aspergillus steynii IBT 23096]PLB45114.1 DnaJ-domain-containing protein [Aspergillus steynii IBT 23096]